MPDWINIAHQIRESCGESLDTRSARSVGGGCINSAFSLDTESRQLFIKINNASNLAMFEAEFEGLTELVRSNSIRVPEPLCVGVASRDSYLVMEKLHLGGSGNAGQLGENLAALHQTVQPTDGRPRFGWHRDNTIGSTPQINDYENDWPIFWSKHRLSHQLTLAQRNGADRHLIQQGEKLCENLATFFSSYSPQASLLHGDLWSGNYAFDQTGTPVIFDPAVYYGDRETDLAMTELFGGFSANFYAAYNAAYRLDEGYAIRKTLYNLYHILNHFNIFGGSYLSQAGRMADQLVSELG